VNETSELFRCYKSLRRRSRCRLARGSWWLLVTFITTGILLGGSSSAFASPAPGRVDTAPTAPSNTSLPKISGTAQQGQSLTAAPGSWSGTTPISYAYQWARCDKSYRDTVLAASPLAYWRFGETGGSAAADASGNSNSGAYGGGYVLGQAGAIAGDPDTAVRFTSSTGDVLVQQSGSLNYGDSVSYEAWVKLASLPPTSSAGANIMTKNAGTLLMRIYPSGIIALRQSGGNEIARSTLALIADGKYHHVAGTKSGGAVHIYLDGTDVTGTVTNQTLTNNSEQLVVGHNPVSSNDGLDGYIDEVAVYGTALSPGQVGSHYAIGIQPSCTDIGGANKQTFTLTASDVGRAIVVRVSASNSAGSSSATSAPTAPVSPASPSLGYRDQQIGNAGVAPTGSKPESKLWWNDGSWWASMWSAGTNGFDIFRLNVTTQVWTDTGVRLDDRSGTRADALWSAGHLYVASHAFSPCGCSTPSFGHPSRLYRYTYDSVAKTYGIDPGFPVAINDTSTETLTIDRDSLGTLWATWAQGNQVFVTHTVSGDSTWVTPFVLSLNGAKTLNSDDISSVIAFGGDKVGVMWSNQNESAMYFAVHHDGQPDSAWDQSRNAVPGPNYADDHINLKSLQTDGTGRVVAAVKTSLDDLPNPNPNAPLIMLLVRDPATGDWSNYVFGRVGEHHTRSIVVLDDQHYVIHVFATAPTSGGTIYEKTSPLNSISFPQGLGTPVIHDADSQDMNNVTSAKQNVNSSTGLVVMASNDTTQSTTSYPSPAGGYYWHAYEPIAP
jgi:concanavalin A-like lectin/glucanase superfamily protein